MKLRSSDVLTRYEVIRSLFDKKLPGRIAFALAKNYKALGNAVDLYEKSRIKVCQELARKDDAGNPIIEKKALKGEVIERYSIPADKQAELEERLKHLQDMMIDVNIMTVPVAEFDKIDRNNRFDPVSPGELMLIDFMLA